MKNLVGQRGFTLVESLIYFIVVGIFLLSAMLFALQILDISKLSENFSEVQSNGIFSTQKIIDAIHGADSVNEASSIFDNDNGKLVLNDGAVSVSFYLQDSDVYMKEGAAAAVKLNSDNVSVSQLRFHQIKSAKTPTQIVIDGLVATVSEIANLSHSFPFHLSVSLRSF
jgi:Tfp pilus assembly protein PilV